MAYTLIEHQEEVMKNMMKNVMVSYTIVYYWVYVKLLKTVIKNCNKVIKVSEIKETFKCNKLYTRLDKFLNIKVNTNKKTEQIFKWLKKSKIVK